MDKTRSLYLRNYRATHRLKIKKLQHSWYIKHKKNLLPKFKNFSHKWYLKNKDRINAKAVAYQRIKYKTDINFKLTKNLRRRVSNYIAMSLKDAPTIELLGCSIEQLKQHLISKFKPGMSWRNYGKWHVDHIRPCASFDLSKPAEQRKCFHYTNLQPLWAGDNLRKGSKVSFQ
jgi:hypothetical protein